MDRVIVKTVTLINSKTNARFEQAVSPNQLRQLELLERHISYCFLFSNKKTKNRGLELSLSQGVFGYPKN